MRYKIKMQKQKGKVKKETKHTREVKLVGRIKLETTSCWEKRSGNGGNRIGRLRSGTFKRRKIVRVTVRVMVMLMMMRVMKVRRRRRRSGGRGGGGMAKRKLEEIPDLRFGVRLGFSYGHFFSLPRN